ncbi:Abortive bacteriophage infection, resistance [Caulobacteraceae bacterium]
MADDLSEDFDAFWDDLLLEAQITAEPQQAAFFQLYSRLATENGDCTDLQYTPVRKEGRGGYQVDGIALESERGDLYLAVSDFRSDRELETLNAAPLEEIFNRVRNFCELSVQPAFINGLEETSPAFEAAYLIFEKRAFIKRVRVIVFSNARLATRKKPEAATEWLGVPVVYSVLDFRRYVDIGRAHGGTEPIEIDLAELNSGPLPCLSADSGGGDYQSYLIVMPGDLLARIYGLYGPRLLEQNVRTFLQARTKVNSGIISTIETSPEMFFAYNNGLTATASGIELAALPDGSKGIASIANLQIVNGGQTTASILYARDQRKAKLDTVFVQMKLSVIKPERVEEIVPKISRYANTQNKINEADFFSSHPFHLVMERVSRRLAAPARPGSFSGSKWFYERARGQYKDQQAYGTPAARKKFEVEFPKDQLVDKTDLAKYVTTFDARPNVVSQGAQKCFLEFAERIGKAWETSELSFNDQYFRDCVARTIVFRWTDHMIGSSAWYKEDRGFKAQAVTYTVAWLVDHIRKTRNAELDLSLIWNAQEVPAELAAALEALAPQVSAAIREAPATMKNVGEYCKSQACWASISGREFEYPDQLSGLLADRDRIKEERKAAKATRQVDQGIEFDELLIKLLGKTGPILAFATSRKLLSPQSNAALGRLARGDPMLGAAEKNALKQLFERMQGMGFEFNSPAQH